MKISKPEMRVALKEKTGCEIQHNGWPCGTCFFSISQKLTNEDWQSLLLFRGDYRKEDLDNLPKNPDKSIIKIFKLIKEGAK